MDNSTHPRGINALELLVVMFIMGVIASMLFPTFSRARSHAKVAETKMIMVQLGISLEMYHNEFREYPETLMDLNLIGIDPDDLPLDPFNPDDGFFQYFTNKYPYTGSFFSANQLWGLTSYGPDRNGDVQHSTQNSSTPSQTVNIARLPEIGGNISLPAAPNPANTPPVSSYDAMVDMVIDRNFNAYHGLETRLSDSFQNGDVITFGPVPIYHLLQRHNPDGSMSGIPWGEYFSAIQYYPNSSLDGQIPTVPDDEGDRSPGQSGEEHGNNSNAPGQTGDAPGKSGEEHGRGSDGHPHGP